MTINTFVGLIEQLRDAQKFTQTLKDGLEAAAKQPGNSAADLKYAGVLIELADRYEDLIRVSLAGAANLALTHGNEPHDRIIEAMSK